MHAIGRPPATAPGAGAENGERRTDPRQEAHEKGRRKEAAAHGVQKGAAAKMRQHMACKKGVQKGLQ